jgi:hypothetical protein
MNDDFTLYPILDTMAKDFRHMMYETSICEFDFNNYVFARQVHLLFKLENSDMVAELAATFIPDMMYQLQDYFFSQDAETSESKPDEANSIEDEQKDDTPKVLLKLFPLKRHWTDVDIRKFLFVRSWAYCAADCVVSKLSTKKGDVELLYRRMGDLYMFTRFQLSIIGNVFGLSKEQFDRSSSNSDQKSDSISDTSKAHLMDFSSSYEPGKRLAAVMQSQEQFDKLFIEISEAASSKYQDGNRNRFVNKLAAEMASIRFREERYEESLIALQPIVQGYETDHWSVLKLDTERKLAECEKNIGRIEYYVKYCVDLIANPHYMNEMKKYMNTITDEVETAVPRDCLRVGIESITGRAEVYVENGAMWKFVLVFYNQTQYFKDFPVDNVVVTFQEKLQEGKPKKLHVNASGFTLGEEMQRIVVKHRMNTEGVFQVSRVKLQTGKLSLIIPIEYDHPPTCLPQEQLHKQREPIVTTKVVAKRERRTHAKTNSMSGSSNDLASLDDIPQQQTTVLTYFEPGFLVTAGSGEGALEISVRKQGCLIVDKDQILYLSVKNPSEEDPVDNVKILLQPSDPILAVLSPQGGSVTVTHLEPNETLEFPIRIRAQKSSAGSCVFCSLAFVIEEQNVNKKVDLSFFEPFIYFYNTKVIKEHHIMLQVTVESTIPEPMDVTGYKLDPKAGVDLVKDFNTSIVAQPRRLLPDQAISFAFIVSTADTLLEIHKSILQLSYRPQDSELILTNDIPVSFSTITRKPFSICLSSVGMMVMGEFCHLKVEIKGILTNKIPSVMSEVICNEWLVVGKNKQLLEESNAVSGNAESGYVWLFDLQVVPLVSGYTTFPLIQLAGATSDKIDIHYQSDDGKALINGQTVFVRPSIGEVSGPLYPLNFPTPKVGGIEIQPTRADSVSELDELSGGVTEGSDTPPGAFGIHTDIATALTFRDFDRIQLEHTNLLTARGGGDNKMTFTSRGVYDSIQARTKDPRDDDSI